MGALIHRDHLLLTKICKKCFCEKPLFQFTFYKTGRMAGKPCCDCRACVNARSKKWYFKNVARHRACVVRWRKENIEQSRAQTRKSVRAARIKDPGAMKRWLTKSGAAQASYKLAHSIRVRIRSGLSGTRKATSSEVLIGCSFSELRAHLENQFSKRPGMSWETRCFWHIDHIKPCASFDLTDAEQQKKCFHFSNLQPLWAIENLQKGEG